ncbi:MAG: hypothetical protein LBG94_08225 [Treponema sp.]|jgi:hypothetical protein|nr:hypothetical protein [Treponema sp.]
MGSNKYIYFIIIAVIATVISCNSAPKTTQEPPVNRPVETTAAVTVPPAVVTPVVTGQPATVRVEEPKAETVTVFDPANVSEELYKSTREEVQLFIENLNEIIKNRDYNAWQASLSSEYIDAVASPVNLNWISDSAIMKRNHIVLKDLNDYFTYVVIPARSDDRIHSENVDIEFINENRVTAFTTRTSSSGEGIIEILYDLEKIDNSWKIIY